jgi:magnesium transporter
MPASNQDSGQNSSSSAGKMKTSRKRKLVRLFDRGFSKKSGLPPGTVIHTGPKYDFEPWVSLVEYNADTSAFIELIAVSELKEKLKIDRVNWINVEGIHNTALIQEMGQVFDLHVLTQEDIANAYLRPQFESYPGYYFFALQMLYVSAENRLVQEHVSIVFKDNMVITFQETPGDVFGKIRDRISSQTGKVRARGADYLVYMLLDSIVDGYYQVVDQLGERIDAIEEALRCGPRDQHLAQIFELRREILFLRKNILPVRELLNKVNVEGGVFQDNTKIFLKDLSDHILQVADSLSLSMEMSGVLIDTYHSMQNQRLNAIMKTLTMISTIFLPLNFIAGIYGMNFKHMPELDWEFGYPAALVAMIIVLFAMLGFFMQKGWILENVHRSRSSPSPNKIA